MKNLLIILSIAMFLVSCASKNNTSFDVKFGIFGVQDGAGIVKKETRILPFITKDEGQVYGIRISPSNNEPYNYYIVAYLPKKPKMLSGALKEINPGQSTKGIRFPKVKTKGISFSRMWFDDGDPLGTYILELYINDKLYEAIEFEAIEYNRES